MENGLEINADKTKYIVFSRYQITGRIVRIKNENISAEILINVVLIIWNTINEPKLYLRRK